MVEIGFKQISEMDKIKDLQKIEEEVSNLPEVGFKMSFKANQKQNNFAEDLIDSLK